MKEKILTPAESKALVDMLMAKYKSEIQEVNVAIQRDIDLYGHVTLETEDRKDALHKKIMNEKEKL